MTDARVDILTWCCDAVWPAGPGLCMWRVFSFWRAEELPAPFDAVAVCRLRGRSLPQSLTMQCGLVTMDYKPLGEVWKRETKIVESFGEWSLAMVLHHLACDLHYPEQIFLFEFPQLGLRAELPLPVVLVQ